MFSDLKRSINSIVTERVSNPFWGALTISWIVWNWRIWVLLFFTSENNLPFKQEATFRYNKVEYIISNYLNISSLIIGPIVSTLVILLIAPFFVNGSYWLSLKFKQWRNAQRDKVEMRQLLSLEQSVQLRKQIKEQEKEFKIAIEDKDFLIESSKNTIQRFAIDLNDKTLLIDQYKKQIESINDTLMQGETARSQFVEENEKINIENRILQRRVKELEDSNSQLKENLEKYAFRLDSSLEELELLKKKNNDLISEISDLDSIKKKQEYERDISRLVERVTNNFVLSRDLDAIIYLIQKNGGRLSGAELETASLAFFEGNDIFLQQNSKYSLTPKGKEFLRQFSEKKLDNY